MNRKIPGAILGLWIVASWPAAALAADVSAGKAIYEKSCVGCHGKDGKGNPAMAKVLGEKGLDLTAKKQPKNRMSNSLKSLSEGAGKMPAQKSLSTDEQKQVLSYTQVFSEVKEASLSVAKPCSEPS